MRYRKIWGDMAYNNQGKGQRVNGMIRVREVFLIGSNGEQLGVLPTREAQRMAEDIGLDLVEVSPNARPPVCKILDYGKYKFEQEKKIRDSKKNQKIVKLKEVRMQPKIGGGDMDTKARHIDDFLESGAKVKVTIRFRGRELAHTDLGYTVLEEILKRLKCGHVVETAPALEGRTMSMTISAKGK